MWGVFTLYMWIATFRTNFTSGQFPASLDTFFLLREPTWEWGQPGRRWGGWFGLATGLDALYLSLLK